MAQGVGGRFLMVALLFRPQKSYHEAVFRCERDSWVAWLWAGTRLMGARTARAREVARVSVWVQVCRVSVGCKGAV